MALMTLMLGSDGAEAVAFSDSQKEEIKVITGMEMGKRERGPGRKHSELMTLFHFAARECLSLG